MASAKLKLSAQATGFETRAEFDRWVAYVAARIEKEVGFPVEVKGGIFSGPHATLADEIQEDKPEQEPAVRAAIQRLWDRACRDGFTVQ